MLTIPFSLLLAHFIGDFVLQTDAMALNKSKSWLWLFIHVSAYTFIIGIWAIGHGPDNMFGWFIVLTFASHFITDAITSRITSKLWFVKFILKSEETINSSELNAMYPYHAAVGDTRHWFFVCIGADQLIHYFTLAWTLRLLS